MWPVPTVISLKKPTKFLLLFNFLIFYFHFILVTLTIYYQNLNTRAAWQTRAGSVPSTFPLFFSPIGSCVKSLSWAERCADVKPPWADFNRKKTWRLSDGDRPKETKAEWKPISPPPRQPPQDPPPPPPPAWPLHSPPSLFVFKGSSHGNGKFIHRFESFNSSTL